MPSDKETILELENVGCKLDKDKSIFHDVNWAVHAGDILVLRGKSGSGSVQETPYSFNTRHNSIYGPTESQLF